MQLDLVAHLRDALRDRYLVDNEIGRGGMALVCRARDLRHDRAVAIKVLYPDLARAVGGERFLREIAILARLSHPNILPLLDSGSIEIAAGLQVPWYVMPLLTEETLRGRLSREGPLPVDRALQLAEEVAAALVHAHAGGFIHRDIKPENILLSSGHAVLADFGIARAVTVASGGSLSSTGIVVGTPAYMSPEQSAGSAQLDGRTDLYSLGIVLYEMLAGHPPFSGNTPQALSARHQFETPPPIQVVRPTVPDGVARLLQRMLAKVPGDRLASAEELRQALQRLRAAVPAEPATRGTPAGWRRRALVGAAAVLVIGAGSAVAHRAVTLGRIDAERVVVLPFQHVGDAAPALIGGVDCAVLIDDALARWADLPRVDGLRVHSAIAAAGPPHTLREGERLARGLGAGRLVWGQVFQAGDSVRVRAFLYQLGWLGSRTTAEYSIGLPAGASAANPALARVILESFRALARQLMARATGPGPGPDPAESLETTSYLALRAKLSGDSALGAWDLALARRRFREAIGLDPGYPQAQLALAQLGSWFEEPASEWQGLARLALRQPARLTPRQLALGHALAAMAEGRSPEACETYRGLLASDSLDFTAWFGLGECQARDRVVVPAPASPSGYAFRGSYQAGLAAYQRAMELLPVVHHAFAGPAITQLLDRYFVEVNRFRGGYALAPDTVRFGAFPLLKHDTLVFIPRPLAGLLGSTWPSEYDPTASALGRRALRETTRQWVRALPGSGAAWRAHGIALELTGALAEAADPAASALGSIRAARALPTGGREAIELAVTQVRIQLKLRRFTDAASLADSLLRQAVPTDPQEAGWLAGLAALTGRAEPAAELLAQAAPGRAFATPEGQEVIPSGPLAADAQRLLAYAALGGPFDSLQVVRRRVGEAVAAEPDADRRPLLARAVTDQAAVLAFPALGAPSGRGLLRGAEQELALGNGPAAAVALGRLASLRARQRSADQTLDGVLLEARLWLLAGDTLAARDRLGGVLKDLPAMGRDLIGEVPQAAALPRAIALLAQLSEGRERVELDSLHSVLTSRGSR